MGLQKMVSSMMDPDGPFGRTISGRSPQRSPSVSSIASTGIFQQVSSPIALSLTIDPDLLRGVRMEHVMNGAGKIFAGRCAGAMANGSYYQKSELVDTLDDFISHDWLTPRPLKYLTLCFVYNARPAAVCSAVAGTVFCLVQGLDILPLLGAERSFKVGGEEMGSGRTGGWCTLVAGPATFWVVFFFWQRMRMLMRLRPVMTFVDKICIDQTNEDRKYRAVRSLAGFLDKSQRLVILWSPRYFTRLWCTYEVATWIHLKKTVNNSVLFMPVILTPVYLLLIMVMHGVVVFFVFMGDEIKSNLSITFTFLGLGMAVAHHLLRHLLKDLSHLVSQLESFNIRHSECYCCTNGHIDPVDGNLLSCDRTAVYATVTMWFGGEESAVPDQDAALDEFDRRVRNDFANNATISAGRTGPRLNDYSNALIASSPLIWYGLDRSFPAGYTGDAHMSLRTGIQWLVIYLTAVPIAMSLTLQLASCLQSQADSSPYASRCRLVCTALASVGAAGLIAGLFYAQWAPGENLSLLHQLLIAAFQVACAAWLYRRNVTATLRKHIRLTSRRLLELAEKDELDTSVSNRDLSMITPQPVTPQPVEIDGAKDVLPEAIARPQGHRLQRLANGSPCDSWDNDDHIQIMESTHSDDADKKSPAPDPQKTGVTLFAL